MGSLSFAIGGGLAQGGAAASDVGREALAQQRLETIERLRNEFAKERQQTGIEAQKSLQQAGFAEQEKMHGIEHGEAVAAAGAQRGFLKEQEQSKEAAAQKRTETTGQYRVKAAQARVAGSTKPPPPVLRKVGQYQLQGSIDPVSKQPVPGATIPILQHRNGQLLVQAGDMYLPYDATKGNQLPDTKGVSRPKDARAVQDVVSDPNGITASGRTKIEEFYDAYKYVPAAAVAAQQRAQDNGGQKGPLGRAMPSTATWKPEPGEEAEEASEDAEDARQEAEDNAPAQEPGASPSTP